jgi:hypothetical protein
MADVLILTFLLVSLDQFAEQATKQYHSLHLPPSLASFISSERNKGPDSVRTEARTQEVWL